jgi:hypothetical protein
VPSISRSQDRAAGPRPLPAGRLTASVSLPPSAQPCLQTPLITRRAGEAIPLLERTLAGRERVLGLDHPSTVTVRDNLASARASQG